MAAATTADFLVGTTIGEGSYGRVIHATYKATGKDAAIKVITKMSIQKDPTLMDGVMRERRLLSELKSEYVVSLWASFHDSECLYFVMECLTGGDLAHVIRSGLLPERYEEWSAVIPHYTIQILSALEFLHTRNVVHGDLKPENILVSTAGRLKLADFGAAIELKSDSAPSSNSKQQPFIAGTADYASPEVVRGETHLLSVGIDLWSLGCLLYAMWEGVSPFHDQSDALAIQRIVQYCKGDDKQQRNLTEASQHISNDWKILIRDLMSPAPLMRLGVTDFHNRLKTADAVVAYTSIRERACLHTSPSGKVGAMFQAPAPSWWSETQTTAKRDGAEGWSIFLF